MMRWKLSLVLMWIALLAESAPVDLNPPGIFEAHVYNLSSELALPKTTEDKAGGIAELGPVKIMTVGEHYVLEATKAVVEDDKLWLDLKLTLKVDQFKVVGSEKIPGGPKLKDGAPVVEEGKPVMEPERTVEKELFSEKPEIYFTSKETIKIPLPDSIPMKLAMTDAGPVLMLTDDAISTRLFAAMEPALAPDAIDKWLVTSMKLEKPENKGKVDEWIAKVKLPLYETLRTKIAEMLKDPQTQQAVKSAMTKPLPKFALWGDTTMSMVYERLRVGPPDPALQKVVWHLRPEPYQSPASSELTQRWRTFEPTRTPKIEGVKVTNRVKLGIGGAALTSLMQNYLKSLGQPPMAGQAQQLPEGVGIHDAEKLLTFYADNAASKDLVKFLAQYRSEKIDVAKNYLVGVPLDGSRVIRFVPWKSTLRVTRTSNDGKVVDGVRTSYLDVAVKFTVRSLETPKVADEIVDLALMFRVTPHKTLKLIWVAPIDPTNPQPAADSSAALTKTFITHMESALKPLILRPFTKETEADPALFAIQTLGEPTPRPGARNADRPAPPGETAQWVEAIEFNYNP